MSEMSSSVNPSQRAAANTSFGSDGANTAMSTKEYYDIVMVGGTGLGKSTLGNKLLNVKNTDPSKIRLFTHENSEISKKRFTVAHDRNPDEQMYSVTRTCKLIANDDSNIRVLYVPGFSDTRYLQTNVSLYEGNLEVIRGVVASQIESNLKVRRIVYFLPIRGPLEKPNGLLKEELQVLYYFFGKKVFECMVFVATIPEKFQKYGCTDRTLRENIVVLTIALKVAIPEDITCPPIVYIGLYDSHSACLSKIHEARVVKDKILPLKFSEDTCARCAIKMVFNAETKKKVYIIHSDGTTAPYEGSKCHPRFVVKYTGAQKFFGGVAHIATLGVGLLVDKVSADNYSWPGDEIVCAMCQNSPGSKGCIKVGRTIIAEDEHIYVDHSNKV